MTSAWMLLMLTAQFFLLLGVLAWCALLHRTLRTMDSHLTCLGRDLDGLLRPPHQAQQPISGHGERL